MCPRAMSTAMPNTMQSVLADHIIYLGQPSLLTALSAVIWPAGGSLNIRCMCSPRCQTPRCIDVRACYWKLMALYTVHVAKTEVAQCCCSVSTTTGGSMPPESAQVWSPQLFRESVCAIRKHFDGIPHQPYRSCVVIQS